MVKVSAKIFSGTEMSSDNTVSKEANRHIKPYYVPYRADRPTIAEKYAHVVGDGYLVIKRSTDKNKQDLFQVEVDGTVFFVIAMKFPPFDCERPTEEQPRALPVYNIVRWLLSDWRQSSPILQLPPGTVESYRRIVEEALPLFADNKKINFLGRRLINFDARSLL